MIRITTPLEQFEIHPIIKLGLGWIDGSITNSTITLSVVLGILIMLTFLVLKEPKIIPTRWQSVLESSYQFLHDTIREQIGEKGYTYFPFIFTLFHFILLCNLVGMIPYSFTVTTHIVITFAISLMIFVGVTILGFKHHGLHFLSLLLPAGASLMLAPLLILIELISYFARAISLAVRLAANMMAGHTLLKIIATFGWKMILAGGLITLAGMVPILLLIVLSGLELAIALLQAYVFTVLTCSYLNDSIHLH